MALKGTALAAAILLVFAFIGDWLLTTLGITLPAFKIAGAASGDARKRISAAAASG